MADNPYAKYQQDDTEEQPQTAAPAAKPAEASADPYAKYKEEATTSDDTQSQEEKPGFFKRLGQSLGVPTSKEEVEAAAPHIPKTWGEAADTAADLLAPGASQAGKMIYHEGKKAIEGIKDVAKESTEAGENIAEGGPVGENLGKMGSSVLKAGVRQVPFIGEPTQTAGEDIQDKNYAGAAGGLTGAIGQVALESVHSDPYVREKATAPIRAGAKIINSAKAHPEMVGALAGGAAGLSHGPVGVGIGAVEGARGGGMVNRFLKKVPDLNENFGKRPTIEQRNLVGNDYVPPSNKPVPPAKTGALPRIEYGGAAEHVPAKEEPNLVGNEHAEGIKPDHEPTPAPKGALGRIEYGEQTPASAPKEEGLVGNEHLPPFAKSEAPASAIGAKPRIEYAQPTERTEPGLVGNEHVEGEKPATEAKPRNPIQGVGYGEHQPVATTPDKEITKDMVKSSPGTSMSAEGKPKGEEPEAGVAVAKSAEPKGGPKAGGETVGTQESTDADNAHVARAKSELGANAPISKILERAQTLKEEAATEHAKTLGNKPAGSVPPEAKEVTRAANDYNEQLGKPPVSNEKVPVDPRAPQVADAYDALKHDPTNPEVQKSYAALIKETMDQFHHLLSEGYKFDTSPEDPYQGEDASKQMLDDIHNNKHLSVWEGGAPPADHPLSAIDPETGKSYNSIFRFVHDIMGHGAGDNDFSQAGEENAYNRHAQSYSPEAIPALTTETKGQTSHYFNNEKVRNGGAHEFAEQKAGLLPEEFYAKSEAPQVNGAAPEQANAAETHPEDVLSHIESGKDHAVLTAENPNNGRISDEENATRNEALKKELIEKGYKPVDVTGHTKDVEGETEHSFFVPDIKPADAAEFGRKYGQQAVLTNEGLHDLNKDVVNLVKKGEGIMTDDAARKQPYYSRVGDVDFSVPLDFDKEVKPGEAEKPAVERRTHPEERKRVEGMSPEEMKKELLTSKVTDLPNRRAFDEQEPAEAVGMSDADGLKALNDKFGYDAGNALLKAKAEALKDAGLDAYHDKGDEFLYRGESPEDLQDKLEKARQILRNREIQVTMSDGTTKTFKGADFSYGTGDEVSDAERGLKDHKSEREAKGERARGELRGITEVEPKAGEEPKGAPAEVAPEAKETVNNVVKDLAEQDIIKAGKKYDVDHEDYDFKKRDENRHRVERDQYAKDVTEAIPEEMKQKLLAASEAFDDKDNYEFSDADRSSKSRAARAKAIWDKAHDPDFDLKEHMKVELGSPKASAETANMSDEELKAQGFTPEDIEAGRHLPAVGGGAKGKATGTDIIPEEANKNMTDEERQGLRSDLGRRNFVDKLKSLPKVQEFVDAAIKGQGGRKWYQRSAAAFDALASEAPRYFQEGDRGKFTDFVASLSPQQTVTMNLKEALNAWTKYVDAGRPTGRKLEQLLYQNTTLPDAKVPNAMKALAGDPLWPDVSKSKAFKVPSFAKNLQNYLNYVTNDGWQALFGGLKASEISSPTAYHPLSVMTRAAADALGWEPAEAQAAIWAFTKALTEHGETEPAVIRQMSEDFADIMANDPEVWDMLAKLGVDHEQLDAKLKAIGAKPSITERPTPTTENSVRKLGERVKKAGRSIPKPKDQRSLDFTKEKDEESFNPDEL